MRYDWTRVVFWVQNHKLNGFVDGLDQSLGLKCLMFMFMQTPGAVPQINYKTQTLLALLLQLRLPVNQHCPNENKPVVSYYRTMIQSRRDFVIEDATAVLSRGGLLCDM